MKKNPNIKSIIIFVLMCTIVLMGIGFIFLSIKLNVKTNTKETLKVEFIKIESETPIKGGFVAPNETKTIINNGLTADFKFTLNTPQDELSYTLTLKNTGTLPAKIISISSNPNYIQDQSMKNLILPVTINQTTLSTNKLEPGETTTIKLIVFYGNGQDTGQKVIPYQLTILATTDN